MSHEARHLTCSSCGAPVGFGDRLCGHCQAELATVRCPSCFDLQRAGSKHCAQCSALLGLEGIEGPLGMRCPRCLTVELVGVMVGTHHVGECMKCTGLFVEHPVLEHITRRAEQNAGLRLRPLAPTPSEPERTVYLKCPACDVHMTRRGFADRSGVIVDICAKHGVWFDRDELAQVIEFVDSGGLARIAERDRVATAMKRFVRDGRAVDAERLESYDMVGSFLRRLVSDRG
jgi:Zn-finger nucleic acid-binding protein